MKLRKIESQELCRFIVANCGRFIHVTKIFALKLFYFELFVVKPYFILIKTKIRNCEKVSENKLHNSETQMCESENFLAIAFSKKMENFK